MRPGVGAPIQIGLIMWVVVALRLMGSGDPTPPREKDSNRETSPDE